MVDGRFRLLLLLLLLNCGLQSAWKRLGQLLGRIEQHGLYVFIWLENVSFGLYIDFFFLLGLKWNEAIRTFNNGVPRKRHWRQLRQYENCFTASEAVSWLHLQLKVNPHFGPAVTKDQIQQLLCKFLKAGVFEDVRGVECKVEHFKDNSGLYRWVNLLHDQWRDDNRTTFVFIS